MSNDKRGVGHLDEGTLKKGGGNPNYQIPQRPPDPPPMRPPPPPPSTKKPDP